MTDLDKSSGERICPLGHMSDHESPVACTNECAWVVISYSGARKCGLLVAVMSNYRGETMEMKEW
jgi:hypothetical protein